MKTKKVDLYSEACMTLFSLSLVSIGWLVVRMVITGSQRYWFLSWNLLLAWVPILFAILLAVLLKKYRWMSWRPIVATGLWLAFLPNSFYLMTDFLHTYNSGEISELFDVVLFGSFAFTGLLLGFFAILIVHEELGKRLSKNRTALYVLASILLSSFAIYMGRYLRWNSWDIIVSPVGMLVDVFDRISRPSDYPTTFAITLIFFVFISSFYFGLLYFVRSIKDLVK